MLFNYRKSKWLFGKKMGRKGRGLNKGTIPGFFGRTEGNEEYVCPV